LRLFRREVFLAHGSSEEELSLTAEIMASIFIFLLGCGAVLFFGWAIAIGPWAFDDFMVDILPWRHEYITSMPQTHFIGHYILFGFLAFLGIIGVITGIFGIFDAVRKNVKSRKANKT